MMPHQRIFLIGFGLAMISFFISSGLFIAISFDNAIQRLGYIVVWLTEVLFSLFLIWKYIQHEKHGHRVPVIYYWLSYTLGILVTFVTSAVLMSGLGIWPEAIDKKLIIWSPLGIGIILSGTMIVALLRFLRLNAGQ